MKSERGTAVVLCRLKGSRATSYQSWRFEKNSINRPGMCKLGSDQKHEKIQRNLALKMVNILFLGEGVHDLFPCKCFAPILNNS